MQAVLLLSLVLLVVVWWGFFVCLFVVVVVSPGSSHTAEDFFMQHALQSIPSGYKGYFEREVTLEARLQSQKFHAGKCDRGSREMMSSVDFAPLKFNRQ